MSSFRGHTLESTTEAMVVKGGDISMLLFGRRALPNGPLSASLEGIEWLTQLERRELAVLLAAVPWLLRFTRTAVIMNQR